MLSSEDSQDAKRPLFTRKAISLQQISSKRKLRIKQISKLKSKPNSSEEQFKKEKKRFLSKSKLKSNSWISENVEKIKQDNNSLISKPMPEEYLKNPLYVELWKLGYGEVSINSLMRCGEPAGYLVKEIGGKKELYPITYRCNNRTCPSCSPVRARRIKKVYTPYLNSFKRTPSEQFRFISISPKNYDSLKEGFEKITANFHKWLRRDYVKEKIIWGIWVVEVKQNWKGKPQYDKNKNFLYYHDKFSWNIHIHLLYYGKRLDNVIRGRCLDCGQNNLGYDNLRECYYCKNSKCNSTNVKVKYKDSRIVREWKDSSKEENIHFYISPLERYRYDNIEKGLNYLLKYVSIDKSDFYDNKSLAEYICFIHNKRLINKFGKLGKFEVFPLNSFKKRIYFNRDGERIRYFYNRELVETLLKKINPPPPPTPPEPELDIEHVKIV